MTENASNSFSGKNEKKCSFSQKMPAQSRKAYPALMQQILCHVLALSRDRSYRHVTRETFYMYVARWRELQEWGCVCVGQDPFEAFPPVEDY